MPNTKQTPLTLAKEDMRQYAYKIVDILVEHFENIKTQEVTCIADRQTMESVLLENIPEEASDANEVLDFVMKNVFTHIDLTSHPKFYSFVPSPNNFISVMADTLANGFNVFSGAWFASPAAAQLEITTINWLLKMYNFPLKIGGGIFTSGGSMANLTALTTARRIKCGDNFSKAVIYLSDQAHSSNIKAIRVIGFKSNQIRIIPTDLEYKISINKLKNEIAKDKLKGLQPFCILATAGTTNTGTVDPLNKIAAICKKENLWFHIDGAYGGAAILSEKGKECLSGIEKADSLTVDPHKWFFQPYEIGCLLIRNHKHLSATFSEKPEYLRDIEGNETEINFYDHGIQLTRRFRALKFYMSVKTYGINAFKSAISNSINITEEFEDKLRNSPNWEVVSPATLAVINYRYNPIELELSENEIDKVNQYISKRIIEDKEAVLVTTLLQGKVVLRMCLINPKIEMNDLIDTMQLLGNYAKEYFKK